MPWRWQHLQHEELGGAREFLAGSLVSCQSGWKAYPCRVTASSPACETVTLAEDLPSSSRAKTERSLQVVSGGDQNVAGTAMVTPLVVSVTVICA